MDNLRVGDILICLDEYGWTPGCVTKGKTYEIVRMEHVSYGKETTYNFIIRGNHGLEYRTGATGFMLFSEYKKICREKILNGILD